MKHLLAVLAAYAIVISSMAQSIAPVPEPVRLAAGRGAYVFQGRPSLDFRTPENDGIAFIEDDSMKDEAYNLKITPNGIMIRAKDAKGCFYAMQTLRQMLPSGYEDASAVRYSVPAAEIYDEPRFGYRGFMLDVARFFTPKEDLLRIIDCMAMLKLNRLHLHLCDDNGWRLEIRKYPLLHEIGSCRVDRPGKYFSERLNARQGEPVVPGGYYTQDDIREIVEYASERMVEVIPEIEMPAHSNAALAAYPLLACPVVDKFIGVLPGLGGDHADIIYCAGNEQVYEFLQDILDEVLELFPSHIIHLGGDEAWKTHWKECPLCQARMKEEGLVDEEALQGYFMARMAGYVREKGREVAGWDELANTAIPEDAILYGWRGRGQAAVDAARLGHRIVMTPALVTYLIRYQGPQWFEPFTYFGNNRLYDIYTYEPVKDDWTPRMEELLLGVQASLWTEFCKSTEDVNYLVFPRLTALAEIAWTGKDNRNWDSFLQRLDRYVSRISLLGIKASRSMYNIQHTVRPDAGKLSVELACERTDVQIRYTLDGSQPTSSSRLYKNPFAVSSDVLIKCATFKNGRMLGQVLELPIAWNKATAVELSGAGGVLVNGVRGSSKKSDFEWMTWSGNGNIEFTADLGRVQEISSVALGCINDFGMAVHLPAEIIAETSEDGVSFSEAGRWTCAAALRFADGTFLTDAVIDANATARFVRFTLKGQGLTPRTHCRPGKDAQVCIDEIIVN